jgi:preprotein translocase SecE subunit
MRKVTWPNVKQVRATTGVVLICVLFYAIYFAGVDLLFGRLINMIFDYFGA